ERGLVDVRFAPKATEVLRCREVPRSAITGCEQSQQGSAYSITSSARASSIGGTSRPSALAVLRSITSSNLVGCRTGKSAGFLLSERAQYQACLPVPASQADVETRGYCPARLR